MLHTLDDIDWATLTHACGSADDVPDLLRAAELGDSVERAEAYRELFAALGRQGTVYEATSHVVPFLYELLGAAPAWDDRMHLLRLLAGIARARGAPDLVESARAAVAREASGALPHLYEPHPRVRFAATLLVGAVPATPAALAALHEALRRELALDVRVSLGLVLALHGAYTFEPFDSDDDDLPLPRLELLARAAGAGRVAHDRVLRIVETLADGAFDETDLDELGLD